MSFADLSGLSALATKIARSATEGRRVVVVGPTGAGRWSLGELLLGLLKERAIDVRLPPFEAHDAVLHGLLQVGAALGGDAMSHAQDSSRSVEERATTLAGRLHRAKRIPVVRVPESWWLMPHPNGASRKVREERAQELFNGWFGAKRGCVVLLHDRSSSLFANHDVLHVLPTPRIRPDAFDDESRWGPYVKAFRAVKATAGIKELSPIQLRLLVGLVALGDDPTDIVPTLWGGAGQLSPLLERMGDVLGLDEHREVSEALRRLLRARFALPRETALHIARCPADHVTLLTECIAYEHAGVLRVPDVVRARLRGPPVESDRTHMELAEHHRELDGAQRPPATPTKIVHWLEKAHHLGHAGPEAEEQWSKLRLAPEQLLDRAWSLSVEHKDYAAASKLYERVIKSDPKNAYAWHYLAFNLERSKAPSDKVEEAYRAAVRLEGTNPWWNSRLVTFLIRDLRYAAAEEEWRKCVDRIDPMEARISNDPWLARHVHRWVAAEWLSHGQIEHARAAFRRIPRRIVANDPKLLELRHRMDDAVEAVSLGESVYPSYVPIHERWRAPRLGLTGTVGALARSTWMPGRVLSTMDGAVSFVVATPEIPRRVFKKVVPLADWIAWSGGPPTENSFFEMGFYGIDKALVKVLTVPSTSTDTALSMPDEDDEGDVTAPISLPAL